MIRYTPEERQAVEAFLSYGRQWGTPPLCQQCQRQGNYFSLGEHLAVDGDAHVVTWRCDNVHVLSCAQLLELLL
jgi:hypothetical protein